MISAFTNTLKIPELRQRIFFTLIMVVIVRLGANITMPGVDGGTLNYAFEETVRLQEIELQEQEENGGQDGDDGRGAAAITALINVFSGGALQNCAIFALGIMPYISASIMLQLLTAVVPRLGKLAREEGGRAKINQYTRYVTIALCIFQGYMLAASLQSPVSNPFLQSIGDQLQKAEAAGRPLVPNEGFWYLFTSVLTITSGTLLLMWIGDQITEKGIGNGMSLIITVNIIGGLPSALVSVWKNYIDPTDPDPLKPLTLVVLIALLLIVIAAVISITQAQRRISIQYAKRVVGRKVYGGQTQYLPLKVNYAGVMPIIFASAILLFPSQILRWMFPDSEWVNWFATSLASGWPYFIISGLLIFFFSYFWVATMFQPHQIAEDLKKNGGYIPGVRPGRPTAEFLDKTMSRLTFAGAVFLTIIAVLPNILTSKWMQVPANAAQFFGGTSLLILVGVLLDVMRQVETHLIQRHYDGFLRKGKIRGRSSARAAQVGAAGGGGGTLLLWVIFAIIIIIGVSYFVYGDR